MNRQTDEEYPVVMANRFLTVLNLFAVDAVRDLDQAYRYLVWTHTDTHEESPADRWNHLFAQLTSKAALLEAAHTDPPEKFPEHTGRLADDLYVTAAAFLAAEANDLDDLIELLPDEHRQKVISRRQLKDEKLISLRLGDVADEVGHAASTLIKLLEQGTWQQYADRAQFAQQWAVKIENSISYVAIKHDMLVRLLFGFVQQLVEAALSAEPDAIVGHQIGADMASMVNKYFIDSGHQVLEETRPLIIECLPKLLQTQTSKDFNVAERVQHLADNIAARYDQTLDRRRHRGLFTRPGRTVAR
jgi:hypothetical protein